MRELDFGRCKYPTRGLRALRDVDASNTEIAAALGQAGKRPNQATVSRWRSGESRPADLHRRWLCKLYGIEESAWLLPSEKKADRKLTAAVAKGAA